MQRQIDRFLERIARQDYATNTLIAYQADLAQLLDHLGHNKEDQMTWQQVTEQDMMGYLLYLREREYASSTVSRKMAATSSFFRFLMLQGVIREDPTNHISVSNVERMAPADVHTAEEIEMLWAQLTEDQTPKGLRDRLLVGLMIQAGFRPSELVALNVDDLEALSERLTAQGLSSLQPALERYVAEGRPNLAESAEEGALFLSMGVGAGGGRLTRQGVWLIVKRRAKACGLEGHTSPRSLRRLHLSRRQKWNQEQQAD